MRIKRQLISLLLLIIICLFQSSGSTYAESVRNKKVVSIVYDDSGSMHMDDQLKWAYANYAMQAFAGMLNKEDVLMINYMSSVQHGDNAPSMIDTTNRLNSVNMIRNHSSTSDTPYATIDVAYDNLKSYKDVNSNTQYWLVVMTDGDFNNTELSVVENKLVSIASEKMPNGSLPQIVYLSMCDSQNTFTPKENLRNNVRVRKADKAQDIADVLSDISDEISGRYSIDKKEIKIINDTTVEITSKIPLINIGVLTQFSEAQVTEIKVNNNTSISIESNVPIKYPEVAGRKTDDSLIGNVALMGNGSNNIPAGTYTISFSSPVPKENINIMLEPAIELRLLLYSNGKPIDDVLKLKSDMIIDAEANLYEIGTDNIIDLSLLPSGITHSIKHIEDENEINSTDQLKLSNITLSATPTQIIATLNLPGYFNLYDSFEFTPTKFVVSGIKAEISFDGSQRRTYTNKKTGQIEDDAENVVYISRLKTNKTGVKFIVSINDEPIDKKTAEELLPVFKKSISTNINPYNVEIMDDGSFLVYPSKKSCWYPSVVYWLKTHGEQTITVNLDGVEASEILNIKLGEASCLLDLWPWILLIYVIIWLFFKPRFKKGEIDAYKGQVNENGELVFSAKKKYAETIGWWTAKGPINWISLGAAKKEIGGYTFQGGSNSVIREDRIYMIGVKGKFSDSSSRPTTKLKDNKIRFRSEKIISSDRMNYIHFKKQKGKRRK